MGTGKICINYFSTKPPRADKNANKVQVNENKPKAPKEFDPKLGKELLQACQDGNISKVKELLQKNVDINMRNSYSETSIVVAATYGHFQLVELMIGYDVELNHTESTLKK